MTAVLADPVLPLMDDVDPAVVTLLRPLLQGQADGYLDDAEFLADVACEDCGRTRQDVVTCEGCGAKECCTIRLGECVGDNLDGHFCQDCAEGAACNGRCPECRDDERD